MEKRYYIKDVEKELGVNRKTLFYWERRKKIPQARRTRMGNYRYWTKAELQRLKRLIRE